MHVSCEKQVRASRHSVPSTARDWDAAAQDALVAVMEKDSARATSKTNSELSAALAASERENELKDRTIAQLTAAAVAHRVYAQSQEDLIDTMCKDEIVMQDLIINKVHRLQQALRRSEEQKQQLQRRLEHTAVPRSAKRGGGHCAVSSKISKEHIIGTPRKRKATSHLRQRDGRRESPASSRRTAVPDFSLACIRIGPEFQAVIPDVVPINKDDEERAGALIYAPGESLALLRETTAQRAEPVPARAAS